MLEIACFEITSAEVALKSVVDRIEFCSAIEMGGLTPNIEEFRYLKAKYSMPIYIMIRPNGGSFLYSNDEFSQMKKDIINFKKSGADGFVFGVLNEFGEIDPEKNRILLDLSGGIPCTFHRAFDRTKNIDRSIKTLIELGFSTVLTSGGENSATEGKENIKHLVEKYSAEINILVGGGVRSQNIDFLRNYTKGKLYHSSAILPYEQFANNEEIKKLKEKIFFKIK